MPAKSKDAAGPADSLHVQKAKSSTPVVGSSASVKDEQLESGPNVRPLGEKTNQRGGHGEVPVFEGLMHMTLDGADKGQGKKTERQISSNPQKPRDLESYVPESWILDEIKAERKPLLHLIVVSRGCPIRLSSSVFLHYGCETHFFGHQA